MFKSRSRKDKKNARRRPVTSDDEVEDAVTETLQTVKKRRTLLTTLQYKRGTDASQLLSTTKRHQPTEGEEESLPANTKRSEQQVWKEHHAAAMEDYIRQNMSEHKQDDATDDSKSKPKSHKDELYQQIAETAAELSGKSTALTSTTTTGSVPNTTEVVRSGAATAMAEVILPSASSRKPVRRKYEPQPVAAPVEDGERLGFAAARGLASSQANAPRQPSADDRAYANFVHRQRR